MNFIYGINAVTESLKARARSFAWVGVAKERHDLRLQRVRTAVGNERVIQSFLLAEQRHVRAVAAVERLQNHVGENSLEDRVWMKPVGDKRVGRRGTRWAGHSIFRKY